MTIHLKWILFLSAVLALTVSVLQSFVLLPDGIGSLEAVAAGPEGRTVVAVADGDRLRLQVLRQDGSVYRSVSLPRTSGGMNVRIADMTVGEDGTVYLIKHFTDPETGEDGAAQELLVYKPKLTPFGRLRTHRLDHGAQDEEAVRYNWLSLTSSLSVTGVGETGGTVRRDVYDLDSVRDSATPTIKATRSYTVDINQGVYKAAPAGSDLVYISKSGKVFVAPEGGDSRQLYPANEADPPTTYAVLLVPEANGSVLIGVRNSGDLLRLHTADGRTEYLREGTQGVGSFPYLYRDFVALSFAEGESLSFAAVVQSSETETFEIVVYHGDGYSLITEIGMTFGEKLLRALGRLLLYLLALVLAALAVQFLWILISGSRTILLKLSMASLPLLCATLALFGIYSSGAYRDALETTYRTKAADQGNLMRALFTTSSFDNLTSPSHYRGTEYKYLQQQMETREVYTSSAYFVDKALYTGVDSSLPLLYPYGITMNRDAYLLHRQAALSGSQQIGVIDDGLGERIVSVTPVGSSSGNAVFLLETSIFTAEVDRASGSFIRNYLLVSAACIVVVSILLIISFTRVLGPLREIIRVLERFSRGRWNERLKSKTNDELADISRVFNKMADDIQVQLFHLKTLSDTYYRFIPQRIFLLMGKENLGDLELGSHVEGDYSILCADLHLRASGLGYRGVQELTNLFFSIIHKAGSDVEATLVADSIDLRSLKLICPDADNAVGLAMAAIAQIDSYNATAGVEARLDVSFFLHNTHMFFGVFGDEERYIPAMVSEELAALLESSDTYRQAASRIVVTETALSTLDRERYFYRFIGKAGVGGKRDTGIYDFYDSSPPAIIRLFSDTQPTFDKAMQLYQEDRFYDAKNLFTIVLRENQYDGVARHYVFRCERELADEPTITALR